ncbi:MULTISPECIES: polymorphic toxin-type HINT domain-containing protein [Streptomyces]|uniref:polymorphic toxin-type HINT domain-containing protein n=1 Tax=Streptomyces TaxID=1883 RepID=UPI002248BAD5|nr:polymorphic toxin-type HINT domain-containing protein [Streptomyces sp. JHD 1]MCX2970996.1 polymorphic toxin-type HINT domain-containing protein [Streptomyces sp. JHD 1]
MSTHADRNWFRRPGRGPRRAARRRRSAQGLGASLAALMVVTLLPASALALPPGDPRTGPELTALQQEDAAGLDAERAAEFDEWAGDLTPPVEYQPSAVAVPEGGTAQVPLDTAGEELVRAGDLPVSLGKASPTADDPEPPQPSGTWNVALEPRTTAEGAGVDGALITVTPPATGATPVDVALDYSAFEDLYGTEWVTRLKLEQLPECFLTTPELPECTTPVEVGSANDPGADTVRATVDPARAQASGLSTQAGGGPMVLAATDSAAGAGGTYKATDLSPTGSWTAGGSGGGFSWSYPMTVPAAPAGPAPKVGLSYSSQSVDGKTSVANGQASWVGDGWSYHPGFIERRYRSCADDRAGTPNNDNATDKKKGDLCWAGPNVVMSLGGSTTDLVYDDGTWTPAADSGAKVELKKDTGLGNGDNDGEYWVITQRDGTRFYFGKHAVGDRAPTNSVFTVPVHGNHAGEPCHASAYADSACTQAWRWNLDHVVDVHGNAMVIDWAKETNRYARNGEYQEHVPYVRGGYPKRVDYGLRAGDLDGAPAARVVFSVAERCLKEGRVDCAEEDFTSDNYEDKQPWWDTPATLHCKADAENCYVTSPTFWTRKRLTGVTTYAQRTPGSTALSKVDNWSLEHAFPKQRTDTHPPLWLESVTRTGYDPDGGATTLPPVTFLPNVVDMPNRVARSASDPTPDFDRLRVETIRTETGGEIEVGYSDPCPLGADPAPETNGTRCFPVHWSPDPELEEPETEWFNKYVVTRVVERDRVARQPDVVTTYTYEGDAAWAKDTNEFGKPALRTYSQWRGYAAVTVRKGVTTAGPGDHDATVRTQTRTRYFRGMSEDAGRAKVTVRDSTGAALAEDLLPYQGLVAETLTYDRDGGDVEQRTVTRPWALRTAARPRTGLPDLEAWRAGVERKDAVQSVSGGERTVRTVTTVEDTYGLPETAYRYTLTPKDGGGHTVGDEQCTVNSYVHNPAKHLIGLVQRQRVTVGDCAAAASATGSDVVSDTRTSYDAENAFGTSPVRGLPRQIDTVAADGDGWVTSARSTYDALGRATAVTDADGNTTRTAFSPATGPAFSTTTTNPAGHATRTTVDPGRGTPLQTTDANQRTTTLAYDDLGRVSAVWTPSQEPALDPAAHTFGYQIAEDAPPVVTTRTLRDNGTYEDSLTLLDGLLRPRQTQTEALGGGRVVTDTRYNALGTVAATHNGYHAQGEPEAELFWPESLFQIPNSTETAYDGRGRPVKATTLYAGEADHSAVTTYGGDWTLTETGKTADGTSTRRGSKATKVWTDALGRTTLVQHATDTRLTSWNDTRYAYDARGNHTEVTDHEGNAWSYTYDARGRLTASTDPDMGTAAFTYDALDRQVTATDARGETRHTTYDVLGRATHVREDSADGALVTAYTYDTLFGAKGLPVAATRYVDGAAYTTEVTGYDSEYRPTGTRTTIPLTPLTTGLAGVYTTGQTYTATGKPLVRTLPATPGGLPGEEVVTRYNGEGAPVTTSGHDWYTAGTDYSVYGEVLRTASGEAPHRVWSTAEYDVHTRRLDRVVTDREESGPHRLANTYYGYDVVGNVTWITDVRPDGTRDRQCFSYDVLGQLRHAWTGAQGGCPRASGARDAGPDPADVTAGPDGDGYHRTYTYDAIGNRLSLTDHDLSDPALSDTYSYTYGTAQPHTLTRVDAVEKTASGTVESLQTYSYDAVGNTTARMVGGDTQNLAWTPENKLTTVDTDDDGTADVRYVYDAAGNRLLERTPTGATLFLGDTEVTVDTTGNATQARRYYTHPGAPTTVRSTGGSADRADHELTVLLADHHNTANTAVTLADGMPVQRRKFDPFGNPRGTEPTAWPGRDSFLGTGIDDPATGLTHIGAREYDPTTGRFISVDPLIDITDPTQMNGYNYANNNPVTLWDPSGLRPLITDSVDGDARYLENEDAWWSGGQDFVFNDRDTTVRENGSRRTTVSAVTTVSTAGSKKSVSVTQESKVCTYKYSGGCSWQPAKDYNSEEVHLALDAAGFVPFIGPFADGANAFLYLREGNYSEAAWSLVAFVPVVGDAIAAHRKGGKLVFEVLGTCSASGRHSFVRGTKVLLADGTAKPIEQLNPGDKVLAADPETGKPVVRTVTAAITTEDDKRYVDLTIATEDGAQKVTTTDHHPFWSESEQAWLDAGDLTPGTTLLTDTGDPATVTATRTYTAHQTTHNLTIADLHTYYVLAGQTPVLVHNSGGLCPKILDETYKSASTPAKLEHVIDPEKHGFADLVARSGGREQAMRRIVDSLGDVRDLPTAGRFEVGRVIDGENVTIRGAVVNGVPRIGTAFNPDKFPGGK